MSCNENVSNICVDPVKDSCVENTGTLGTSTNLTSTCVSQKDINGDLYSIVDSLTSSVDVSTLTSSCITIPADATLSQIITLYESKICELNTKVSDLESTDYSQVDLTAWGLDFGCLSDPCGDPITKLGQLLQLIITQTCP